MVVVADTSPINYLVLIAQIDLLKQLYARILIPPAVLVRMERPLHFAVTRVTLRSERTAAQSRIRKEQVAHV